MEIKLEERICLSKRCDKTFKTMPNSKSRYCCEECKYINDGKKKSHQELKDYHGRLVGISLINTEVFHGGPNGKGHIKTGL